MTTFQYITIAFDRVKSWYNTGCLASLITFLVYFGVGKHLYFLSG